MRRFVDVSNFSEIYYFKPFSLFIGSGVSIWGETGVPSGQDFQTAIVRYLLQDIPKSRAKHRLAKHIKMLSFEIINDFQHSEKILDIIFDSYSCSTSNEIHRAIGRGAKNGVIKNIITTNYDLCLDDLLHFTKVVDPEDHQDLKREGVYFKIHGSAENNKKGSIVYRINQEGNLDKWKKDVLSIILTDSDLFFIGYSGIDFDILPEIKNIKLGKVYWNFLTQEDAERSHGLKLIAETNDVVCIIGDMRILIAKLLNLGIDKIDEDNFRSEEKTMSIFLQLKSVYTETERDIWILSLCNKLSSPIIGREIADKFPEVINAEIAQCFFQMGLYKKSAECYKFLYIGEKHLTKRLNLMLDYMDAIRCYGDHRKAGRILYIVAREQTKFRNDYELRLKLCNKILLFEINRILSNQIRIDKTIKNGNEIIYKCKNIYEITQFLSLSKRIKSGEKKDIERLYERLFFFTGKEQLDRHEGKEITISTIITQYRRGIYPEVWKNILQKRLIKREIFCKLFIRSFFYCEYSITRRVFGLLLGK